MGKRSAPIALFPERRRERERDKGKFSPNGLFVYCHLKQILYLRIITTVILFHVICSMSFGFIGFNGYIKQKLQCFHAGCTLDSVINNHFKPSWITLTFVMITPSLNVSHSDPLFSDKIHQLCDEKCMFYFQSLLPFRGSSAPP